MVREYIKKLENVISTTGPELLERLNNVTVQNVADKMIHEQPYYLLDHLGDWHVTRRICLGRFISFY